MATTAKKETVTLNVYQKLLKAREMFLQADVQKTGKGDYTGYSTQYIDLWVTVLTVVDTVF